MNIGSIIIDHFVELPTICETCSAYRFVENLCGGVSQVRIISAGWLGGTKREVKERLAAGLDSWKLLEI